ncbi:hypothetical protein [Paenibacillus jiagnxiensis]|uniref:hypothetical protein n=1 Tax=Paenibacillus jiagnxiensis TaxID=3228926 RepID=UPI0033BA75EB
MQMIYPLEQSVCRQHIGKNVCVVFHDGSYMTGTLSNVTDQGLFFGGAPVASVRSTNISKAKRRRIKGGSVKTKAFGPFGFRRPFFNFAPFAAISLLFLLPFLFI